ncbi:hypothetical protein ACFL57_05480 [Candidatus Margulisiibacteriota bacterium]
MDINSIKELLKSSFYDAADQEEDKKLSSQIRNKNRSKVWVEILSKHLIKKYEVNGPNVRMFSTANNNNREDFGLNELLYDIVVCQVGKVETGDHEQVLHFIQKSLWHVESVMTKDGKAALIDFNKLVLGSAENNLFIGPIVDHSESYIEALTPAAIYCPGNVYAALIPHPNDWGKIEFNTDNVWEFDKNNEEWIR